MAITPRTILTNAAPATVALACLYIFTFIGVAAYKTVNNSKSVQNERAVASVIYEFESAQIPRHANACDMLIDTFGQERRMWSEMAWITYASCYEQQEQYRRSLSIVSQGLHFYPSSETLHNMRGYYLIVMEDYEGAINSLQEALHLIPRVKSGVLYNNLAWAGLWAPRKMPLERARTLYLQSLQLNPNSCETLHTGLWVEYSLLKAALNKDARSQAMGNFQTLRKQYQPCLSAQRVSQGDEYLLTEMAGIYIIYQDIDVQTSFATQTALRQNIAHQLVRQMSVVDANTLCSQAVPMAQLHHHCVEQMTYLGRAAAVERPGCPSAALRKH